jgi:hypothetical protein
MKIVSSVASPVLDAVRDFVRQCVNAKVDNEIWRTLHNVLMREMTEEGRRWLCRMIAELKQVYPKLSA